MKILLIDHCKMSANDGSLWPIYPIEIVNVYIDSRVEAAHVLPIWWEGWDLAFSLKNLEILIGSHLKIILSMKEDNF